MQEIQEAWQMSNVMKRILTSIVLIAAVFAGVFYLSPFYFGLATAVVVLYASYEWGKLAGITKKSDMFWFINDIFMLLLIVLFLKPIYILAIFAVGLIGWPVGFYRYFKWSAMFLLAPCWKAINYLCFASPHPYKLLTLFLIVWLADIAAYAIGSLMGKHKLAPSISPKKSIEGVVGALLVVGVVIGLIFHNFLWVVLAEVTVVAAIVGDLFESFMKRCAGVKDSGNLLPGHGGLLDRIDSLICAAPVFTLGLLILQLK